MGEGDGFVSSFFLCVNKVQCVVSPCWKMYMLMKLWENCLEISMIEVSCKDDESVWVCCLLLTDGLIKFIQRCTSIAVVASWGYVSGNQQDRTYLPGQVERATLHDHELRQ